MAKYPEILSNDGKRLAIMAAYRSYNDTGIEVDKSLPKYSSIKREVEDFKNNKTKATNRLSNMPSSMDVAISDLQEALSEQEAIAQMAKEYNLIKDSDIHGVNLFVNKFLFNDIFSSYFSTATANGESRPISPAVQVEEPKPWYKRLSELLHTKTKELDETYSLDVLQFFAQVKGITKKNMGLYIDRLSGYIVALKNSDMSGQSALKERLLRDMVINKYESVLYATGNYYVITEEQVVEFVKKTERGVRLDYIKNYMRVIPPAVVKKIDKANKLEIFDNYVILHYDPDEKSYAQTIEEKKKEEAKRRDPILFGLIRGSNKLYYITDWVDEYCDLTLDKFDILSSLVQLRSERLTPEIAAFDDKQSVVIHNALDYLLIDAQIPSDSIILAFGFMVFDRREELQQRPIEAVALPLLLAQQLDDLLILLGIGVVPEK